MYDTEAGYHDLTGAEMSFAGFPSQDIGLSGKRAGLKGSRSSLFRHAIKVAIQTKAPFVFLESVKNIIGKDMKGRFQDALVYLAMAGYVTMSWGIVGGENVGLPVRRSRWFLLASRSDADLQKLKHQAPKFGPKAFQHLAQPVEIKLPLDKYLFHRITREDEARLTQVGNCVIPKCAEVALGHLAAIFLKQVECFG